MVSGTEYGAVLSALERDGFARIPISGSLGTEMLAVAKSFYGIPRGGRLAALAATHGGFLGYQMSEAEALAAAAHENSVSFSDQRRRGYSSFDFMGTPETLSRSGLPCANVWPEPWFSSLALSAFDKLAPVGRATAAGLLGALAGELRSEFLEPANFTPSCCSIMRLLKYTGGGQVGPSKAHTDYEFVTLVISDREGLEVRPAGEEWRPLPSGDDCIIVLAGEMLEIASCGRIKASEHRVAPTPTDRHSVIYFQGLPYDLPLPPMYDGTQLTFGEFLSSMIIRSTPHLAFALESGAIEPGFPVPTRNPYQQARKSAQ